MRLRQIFDKPFFSWSGQRQSKSMLHDDFDSDDDLDIDELMT